MAARLASGEKLAAFGLTEANAGSDAGATRTRAELRDGEWLVNGSKIFITNAGTDITACVTITALTGDDEISNIIVPNGTPGYEISAPMKKLGWHASDTRELSFKDCAVPEGNLLGPRGQGFHQFMEILDGGRISVAAMGVGLAQGAYDLAFAYAKEREQFGRPIAKFQAVQFALADMATEIEAGRQLVYRAAWLKDQGRDFGLAAGAGEALHRPALEPRGERVPADPRRIRLHGGVRDLAALPRPEDPRDRRRHERGAAHGHREAPGRLVILAHAAWSAPPVVLGVAALVALLFAQGWLRLRRRGRRTSPSWTRAALFALGLAVALAGLVSPIDTLGEDDLLSMHMLQHVLIGDLGIALAMVAVRGPCSSSCSPRACSARSHATARRALAFLLRPRSRSRSGPESRRLARPVALRRGAAPGCTTSSTRCWSPPACSSGRSSSTPARTGRLTAEAACARRGDVRSRPGADGRARLLVPRALSAYHGAYGLSAPPTRSSQAS